MAIYKILKCKNYYKILFKKLFSFFFFWLTSKVSKIIHSKIVLIKILPLVNIKYITIKKKMYNI